MPLYLDTSCFLKLFLTEPETESVHELIELEQRVIISTVTELETLTQIYGYYKGGRYSKQKLNNLLKRLEGHRNKDPFEFRGVDISVFQTAKRQINSASVYCRTMDRLHLAAMEDLRVRRLLTNVSIQAEAANEMGFQVIFPNSKS